MLKLQQTVGAFQKKFPEESGAQSKNVRKLNEDGETVEFTNKAELKRMETGNIFDDLKEDNIRAARGSVVLREGEYLRDTRKLVDSLINKTKNIDIKIGQ